MSDSQSTYTPIALLQAYGAQLISDFPKVIHYNETKRILETTADPETVATMINEFRQNEFTAHFYGKSFTSADSQQFLQTLDENLKQYFFADNTISRQNLLKFIHEKQQTQVKGGLLGQSSHLHSNLQAIEKGSKVLDPSRSYTAYERFLKTMQKFQMTLKDLLAEPELTAQTVSDSLCLLKGLETTNLNEAT